jgi:hypothetical protein
VEASFSGGLFEWQALLVVNSSCRELFITAKKLSNRRTLLPEISSGVEQKAQLAEAAYAE